MSKHSDGPSKSKIKDPVADKKKAAELSEEELKKVVGGNLGAPIFKKQP